jgi:hypothetical protein
VCSRRQFGQAAARIVLFFSMRPGAVLGQSAPAKLPADLEANRRLDSWLRINPEGNIEIFTGKVELGQGNLTALAQIAAEELDVAFERVRMRPVDTSHSPDEGYTAGCIDRGCRQRAPLRGSECPRGPLGDGGREIGCGH